MTLLWASAMKNSSKGSSSLPNPILNPFPKSRSQSNGTGTLVICQYWLQNAQAGCATPRKPPEKMPFHSWVRSNHRSSSAANWSRPTRCWSEPIRVTSLVNSQVLSKVMMSKLTNLLSLKLLPKKRNKALLKRTLIQAMKLLHLSVHLSVIRAVQRKVLMAVIQLNSWQ